MKKTLGYLCLSFSFTLWGIIALLAFIDLSKTTLATATTLLIIGSEVLFVVALGLLGKEAWQEIKAFFQRK